jgi:quercetin dioxygenase-like cupin family protein
MKTYPEIIKTLPKVKIPLNGAEAYLMQSQNNQLVFFEFNEDTEIPLHSHGAQWGIVVDGKIELSIGGLIKTFRKGDSY